MVFKTTLGKVIKILQGKKWIAGISMRQQNNNNNNNNKNRMRGRGRNPNSNKPSNSLNRNYESNGPDVKIRGNAAHIAEKYTTLARDALSSGDRVVAENYLQHAEHYNRIVAAANAQREEFNVSQAANNRNNDSNDNSDDDSGDQPDVNLDASGDDSNDSNDQGENNRRQPRRREPRNANRNNNRNTQNASSEADGDSESPKPENTADVKKADASDVPAPSEEVRAPRARRTSRKKEAPGEGVTADAAALPQGLIGG